MSDEESPPRRVNRRAALAAGCARWAPIGLSGSGSRRVAEAIAACQPRTPRLITDAAAPAARRKLAAQNVGYQAPATDGSRCDRCRLFIAESDACQLVDGPHTSDGGCSLWVGDARGEGAE